MNYLFQPNKSMAVEQLDQPAQFNSQQRYRLLAPLGQGGMGMVYRAYDRLTGQTVALKQLTVAPQDLLSASSPATDDSHQLLLSLAQEFKFLASLRHPHIISVFDYGFDGERRPYFTMELLDGAQTLRDAGRNLPLAGQIDLLVQTLQALAYLHRRGILHHDLKPENVLVSKGQVRVLDFGLSVLRDEPRMTESLGTLRYLPPEVFAKMAYSPASDLYAVGLMAYEMLVGRHPFYTRDLDDFFAQLMNTMPDLTVLPVPLRPVIGTLLAKTPTQRYPDAQQAITALCVATGQPLPVESVAIRESFLQAATFVGREDELLALRAALGAAQRGRGSAWLIGGESGVGKTRLINELRIHALVAGFQVLAGQGVPDSGGQPYQLWREPLRYLVATASTVDDLTAGVLLPLVPDIGQLLERPVQPAPELDGAAAQLRLLTTIAQLFHQVERPLLLILEDLHWVQESLLPLPYLLRLLDECPILIIGSYRQDERPDLLSQLPPMRSLPLARLTPENMAELSAAMLGELGRNQAVLALLQRETEGNAFFAVEVVRALAEEAGSLGDIRQMTLPATILPNGIQDIIERRLVKLPEEERGLLAKIAVTGRQLDLPLVKELAAGIDVENWWLPLCANTAVLDVQNGVWQFSHSKIRDGLLAVLPSVQLRQHHYEIAQALEAIYPETPARSRELMYHWGQVGNTAKERHYAQIAGVHASSQYAHSDAVVLLSRALALSDVGSTEYFALLQLREASYDALGQRQEQAIDLAAMAEIAKRLADVGLQADVMLRQSIHAQNTHAYDHAVILAQQVVELGEAHQRIDLQAEGRLAWGSTLFVQGKTAAAQTQFASAVTLCQQLPPAKTLLVTLLRASNGNFRQGQYTTAQSQAEEALHLSQTLKQPQYEAEALDRLGEIALHLGQYEQAQSYLKAALPIVQQLGLRKLAVDLRRTMGLTYFWRQEFEEALQHNRIAQQICREIDDRQNEARLWNNMGVIVQVMGNHFAAHRHFQESLRIARQIDVQWSQEAALTNWGASLMEMGAFAQAEECLQESLVLNAVTKNGQARAFTLYRLGQVQLLQGHYQQAQQQLEATLIYLQTVPSPIAECWTLCHLAYSRYQQSDYQAAREHFQQVQQIARGIQHHGAIMESTAGLALIQSLLGTREEVRQQLDTMAQYIAERPLLVGALNQGRVWLSTLRSAVTVQDERLAWLVAQAQHWLQTRRAEIQDPVLQASFVEKMDTHKRLWQICEQHRTSKE